MSNAKRCWREPLLIAPKVPFRNTDIEKECPLRLSVRTRPIRSPLAPCTGWTPSTSSEALPFAQEVRQTPGDAPRRPNIAAQAPGASIWPLCRSHGQIATVATPCGMSNAKRCWRVSPLLSRRRCTFEIQTLKRSVLSVRVSAPARFARPSPRALDEACASGPRPSRTAQEVSKTSGDAPRRPDIAAQAPAASL